MVEIEKPEKYRRCTACLSEYKVVKIVLQPYENHMISYYLCHNCFLELQKKVIEYNAK